MKQFLVISFMVFAIIVIGYNGTKSENLNETTQLNAELLKANESTDIGRICYSGCQQTNPSDVCAQCVSPASKCPELIFGSTDYGTQSDCSVQPQ
jgi:hypothetical protein